uniref:Uncharacterized protein n=1 Tax=Mesocestoides corti TaxID=53468 RepID=A0A5K3G2U0_MESCO
MRIPISNSMIPSQTENSQLPAAAVAAGSRLLSVAANSDTSYAGGMKGISGKRKLRRLSSTTQLTARNRTTSAASTDQYQPGEAPDLKRPVRQHLFTIYCMLSGSTTVYPSLYFCTPLGCIGVVHKSKLDIS